LREGGSIFFEGVLAILDGELCLENDGTSFLETLRFRGSDVLVTPRSLSF
jgi:hypothetical protein